MCVNAEVSLTSFFVGVISSICLIYYGNKKFEKENLSTGIFFIYISFIQLFEYFIWTDIDNKKGINRIITIILPVILYIQPVIFYIIKSIIFKYNFSIINLLIIIYIIYGIFQYNSYLKNESLITRVKNKVLHWKWIKYGIRNMYSILFSIVVFLYFNFYYALLLFILGIFLLIISHKIAIIDYDSIWCLLAAYIPIYMLIGSHLIL
jgi:hypothetical protein